MDYCIIENGIIENMIVCDSSETATRFGALPSYPQARIGDRYDSNLVPRPTELEPIYTGDELLGAMLGLEINSSGGGGVIFPNPLDFLVALSPEQYNTLSQRLRKKVVNS